MAAPANSFDKPLTEKNAALNATNNADIPNSKVLNFIRRYPLSINSFISSSDFSICCK